MTTTVHNIKISEVKNKIPDISVLRTTVVLSTKIGEVMNKIQDVSRFIKKTDYTTRIKVTEGKYFTTVD